MSAGVIRRVHVNGLRVQKVQVRNDEAAGAIVGDGQVGVVERMVNVTAPF